MRAPSAASGLLNFSSKLGREKVDDQTAELGHQLNRERKKGRKEAVKRTSFFPHSLSRSLTHSLNISHTHIMFASIRTNSLLRSSLASQLRFKSTFVPQPTPLIPDVTAFFNKIGRGTIEQVEHFPTWESLFTTSSFEMKEKGLDIQTRKYILKQVEHLRQGEKIHEHLKGKKSYYGGEYKRKENTAKILAKKRAERIQYEE